MEKRAYIFATPVNYKNNKLTGAHRRFLELVDSISDIETVILISGEIPQLQKKDSIVQYNISNKKIGFLPYHISGMFNMIRGMKKIKKNLLYNYAVSLSPMTTISYKIVGLHSIVSLFREDLIGYLNAINVSRFKLLYYRIQEIIAVKASDKIIVQCKNDRINLISRNKKYCRDIENKVFVQINNVNASWIKVQKIEKVEKNSDNIVKILFIGDFSNRRKGHSILLPAVARLLDEGVRLELLIAGDGKERIKCEEQYKKYKEIHFMGYVSNMDEYLKQTDIMVVPSFIDSCPNTILEGLNAGIAVYGTNTGGIPDLLLDKSYMFEPNERSIYIFLKNILESKKYVNDAIKQKERKESLTFNWSEKIINIIENKNS